MTIDEAMYLVLAERPLKEVQAAARGPRLASYLRSQARVTEYPEADFEPNDPPSQGGEYSLMEVAARAWADLPEPVRKRIREFLESQGYDWEDWVFHLEDNLIESQHEEPIGDAG